MATKRERELFYVGAVMFMNLDSDEVDDCLAGYELSLDTDSVEDCRAEEVRERPEVALAADAIW